MHKHTDPENIKQKMALNGMFVLSLIKKGWLFIMKMSQLTTVSSEDWLFDEIEKRIKYGHVTNNALLVAFPTFNVCSMCPTKIGLIPADDSISLI